MWLPDDDWDPNSPWSKSKAHIREIATYGVEYIEDQDYTDRVPSLIPEWEVSGKCETRETRKCLDEDENHHEPNA